MAPPEAIPLTRHRGLLDDSALSSLVQAVAVGTRTRAILPAAVRVDRYSRGQFPRSGAALVTAGSDKLGTSGDQSTSDDSSVPLHSLLHNGSLGPRRSERETPQPYEHSAQLHSVTLK